MGQASSVPGLSTCWLFLELVPIHCRATCHALGVRPLPKLPRWGLMGSVTLLGLTVERRQGSKGAEWTVEGGLGDVPNNGNARPLGTSRSWRYRAMAYGNCVPLRSRWIPPSQTRAWNGSLG